MSKWTYHREPLHEDDGQGSVDIWSSKNGKVTHIVLHDGENITYSEDWWGSAGPLGELRKFSSKFEAMQWVLNYGSEEGDLV